jgi:hypothetical protein
MKKEAEAVLDEWRSYTAALPKFGRQALLDATLDKAPEKILETIAGATGAIFATLVAHLPGLLISVAVTAGVHIYHKRDNTYRFLTRVEKAVDRSIGSLYVPQWRALVGQETGGG